MGYKKSTAINNAILALEAAFPATCTRFTLNHVTHEGNAVPLIKVSTGGQGKVAVLFTGGLHARELAPPDALLSFCQQFLTAFANGFDIIYPQFTDVTGVVYDQHVVPNITINAILDKCDLFVVPCANPDGRDFVLSSSANRMWRKNRRPDGSCPGPIAGIAGSGPGVDINRNFPIAWDANIYYSPAGATRARVSSDACNELFRGYTLAPPPLGPAIEPETQNLIELLVQTGVTYLADVHMYGRKVMYPWGIEQNQSNDQLQSFLNPLFNFQRDGVVPNTSYAEYIPDTFVDPRGGLLQRHKDLAGHMATAIMASAGSDSTAIQRSIYTPEQSAFLYATTGAFDDFTFGRQFIDPTLPNVHAFTVEAGWKGGQNPADPGDDDGEYWPDSVTQYPKVEREIHAALFGLLSAI